MNNPHYGRTGINFKHGESGGKRGRNRELVQPSTKEYRAWLGMKRRCRDKNVIGYPNYGGRGIDVCNEWYDSYETFLQYVGRAPTPDHSLDRIDNNGNYEPGNVCWANRCWQNYNRRIPRGARGIVPNALNAVLAFGT